MNIIYIVTAVFAIAAIAFLVLYFNARGAEREERVRAENAKEMLEESQKRRESAEGTLAEEVRTKNEVITTLTDKLGRSEERVSTLTNQTERDKAELEKLQESFRIEFKNLANEILEEKTTQFKKTNKEELNTLLNPFSVSIKEFKQRVDEIHTADTKQQGEFSKELEMLRKLNKQINEETTNLTKALRGDSKTQGDWGEMILERVLESSSLVKGTHYVVQENIKDTDGRNVRPDVIINMPDNKRIVVDSKVSLTAYVNHVEADNTVEGMRYMREHIQSVRTHINELGSKRYQDSFDAIDFVIMFIPNEPAYLTALQNDPALWQDAYNKNVIVSSPTNLFAVLKIVNDLWRRDDQSRNAIEIAERGGALYDKFVGFVETIEKLGRTLSTASDDYDTAVNQLSEGRGNLVRQVEMLRDLGVKANKSLPQTMLDRAGGYEQGVESLGSAENLEGAESLEDGE